MLNLIGLNKNTLFVFFFAQIIIFITESLWSSNFADDLWVCKKILFTTLQRHQKSQVLRKLYGKCSAFLDKFLINIEMFLIKKFKLLFMGFWKKLTSGRIAL